MSDESTLDYLKKVVQEQQAQILSLEKKVSAALNQAEAAENYSRQDCLIFRGQLNVRQNCNLKEEMMRIIDYHTGIQFPSWCVNTVHWLKQGKSVIIRFNSKSVREAIYRNRVPKDVSRRGLFIHESLTKSKMELVSRCTKLRSEGKISTYYTQGGRVYVKKAKHCPSLEISPDMTDAIILSELEAQPDTYREATTRRERNSATHTQNRTNASLDSAQIQGSNMTPTSDAHETVPKEVADSHETVPKQVVEPQEAVLKQTAEAQKTEPKQVKETHDRDTKQTDQPMQASGQTVGQGEEMKQKKDGATAKTRAPHKPLPTQTDTKHRSEPDLEMDSEMFASNSSESGSDDNDEIPGKLTLSTTNDQGSKQRDTQATPPSSASKTRLSKRRRNRK